MKKQIVILVVLLSMLSIVGCGNSIGDVITDVISEAVVEGVSKAIENFQEEEETEEELESQEEVTFDSPWMGVWESENIIMVVKEGAGLNIYCYDTSKGGGWYIAVAEEEITDNLILSGIVDITCDYDASYTFELDGDQLTYSCVFNGDPTEYMGIVFTRTDRTDLDAAWTELWNN